VVVQAFGKSPYRNLEELRDEIWDVVHKHTDMVSLAETIGVLEIVKYELLESAQRNLR
jgi:hypothetical protein